MSSESFHNFLNKIEMDAERAVLRNAGKEFRPPSNDSSRKPSPRDEIPFEKTIKSKLRESAEPSHAPYISDIEEETKNRFRWTEKVSEADLDQEIEKVFSDVCGEHGKNEFIHYTVPKIKQIYGTNYRKAGLRLLEIINKGAECRPSEIGKYFKGAVSQAELEFSKKNKDEVVKGLGERIEKAILDFRERNAERYNGVVGAVVFGSYAKKNFHLESDLDIIYITKSRNKGTYISSLQHAFDDWLDRKVKPVVKSDIYDPIAIADVEALRDLMGDGSMVREGYIVISPYLEVKKAIEDAFATNSRVETISNDSSHTPSHP